ncbi:hypothetical protein R6Q59_019123 [Mikania micrantha]
MRGCCMSRRVLYVAYKRQLYERNYLQPDMLKKLYATFYHLIPVLGSTAKESDHVTIPVFAVHVTLFPNHGISIGITNHHSLCDASTRFCFLKAWTAIAQTGSDDWTRLDPPIPGAYFGNCVLPCLNFARTSILKEKEGFLIAARSIGENLHKMLTYKDEMVKYIGPIVNLYLDGGPTKMMGVAGTPKLKFYDLDFGFGKHPVPVFAGYKWNQFRFPGSSFAFSLSKKPDLFVPIGSGMTGYGSGSGCQFRFKPQWSCPSIATVVRVQIQKAVGV